MSSPRFAGSPAFYDLVRRLNAYALRRFWRIDGEGLEDLQRFDRGILAINHGHLVDGTVVLPLVRQRILFLCDARAVDAPVLGPVLRAMGILRVDVTRPDPAAVGAGVRWADTGRLLGIFPEGKASGAWGLRPARPGVAYFAAKLRLPVIPIASWGVEAFNRPVDVYVRRLRPVIHVRVSPPQMVTAPASDRPSIRASADAIMVLIARHLPPSLRGVYKKGGEFNRRGEEALAAGWVRPADRLPPSAQLGANRPVC